MPIGSRSRGRRVATFGSSAPPPAGRPGRFDEFEDRPPTRRKRRRQEYEERPATVSFTACLDVAELDERRRPGPTWPAKACELGRSRIVIRARRMCHKDRYLLIAVHLIDDKPTPLFGIVHECVYDGEGMHRIDIDLEHIPRDAPAVKEWIDAL